MRYSLTNLFYVLMFKLNSYINSSGFKARKIISRAVLFVSVCLLISCQTKYDVPVIIKLNKNWQFKKVTDTL